MNIEPSSSAVARLVALLGAGYKVDIRTSTSVESAIWLVHPSDWRRLREKTLIVYGDGLLVGLAGEPPERQFRLEPEDADQFRSFLASVPKPTWWEQNRQSFYAPLGWVLFFGFAYLISLGVGWLLGNNQGS